MEDSLFAIVITTFLLVAITITLALLIWAEITKSLFVRLAILVPFYGTIVFNSIERTIQAFEKGKIFLIVLEISFLIILLISLIISVSIDYKKWSSKLMKKIMQQDDDSHKRDV